MAISYHGGNIIRGTAADRTGGTWTNLQSGYLFVESDTQLIYYWNGTAWVAMGGGPGAEGAFSYIVYKAGATTKSMDVSTKAILSSNSAAEIVVQATIDACGNDSGKCIHIKNSLYTLAASLNFTAINGNVRILGEHGFGSGPQLRPTGDFPAITVDKPQITLENLNFSHNQVAYTSDLISILYPANSCSFKGLGFYDFGNHVGNAIAITNNSTGTFLGMLKHNFINLEIYGFNNSILAEVTAGSTNWITNLDFYNILCWYPKNAGYVASSLSGAAIDHCYFDGFVVQCQTSGANQTANGFDFDTTGRNLYTIMSGCRVIDLGTGSNFAKVNSTTELICNGCIPSYKIGGSGVSSHKVIDNGYYGFARGKAVFSGNATTTDFVIAHDAGHFLNNTPNIARITPGSDAAKGTPYVDDTTITDTNMTVKFPVAPPTGTNNIIIYWEVSNQP